MHYYQFNIGNYRRETHHLTVLEHGVYRMLLDTYYLEEKPLCADKAQLMRTHSIRSADEKEAFENVLSDFFRLTEAGYAHEDCEEKIAKYQEKSEKARQSASARWEKDANASRKQSKGTANQEPKNHKPKTKKPKEKTGADALNFSKWPDDPSPQVWADFKKYRDKKRAAITQTVIDGMAGELHTLNNNGWSVDASLAQMMTRGWQGLKAEWILKSTQGQSPPGSSNKTRDRSLIEDLTDRSWAT